MTIMNKFGWFSHTTPLEFPNTVEGCWNPQAGRAGAKKRGVLFMASLLGCNTGGRRRGVGVSTALCSN